MPTLLCLLFFISGASALIFEVLWFLQAGIVFGNSVLAASLVLGAFMAGMALGNAWMARAGHRVRAPLLFYAALETGIALSGLALVLIFPFLTKLLRPVFFLVLDSPSALSLVRAASCFALLVIPSACMGASLPVLIKALARQRDKFGAALGLLYGANTLGAVAGTLAADAFLVRWLGIRGTGIYAAGLDLLAAGLALALASRQGPVPAQEPQEPLLAKALDGPARRICLAGFVSGFALLALEVAWFRFLQLFLLPYSFHLTLMLVAVLSGVALGGLFASALFSRWPKALPNLASLAALAMGGLLALLYGLFARVLGPVSGAPWTYVAKVAVLSFFFMFPVSLVSGALFTMLGKSLHGRGLSGVRAAGLISFSNTLGGLCGALCAALVLLPSLGLENTFFALALSYGLAALLAQDPPGPERSRFPRPALGAGWAFFLVCLAFFPFGLMRGHYLDLPCGMYLARGEKKILVREGASGTIQVLGRDFLGEPLYYRLLTDSFCMSSSEARDRRYMKAFAYLPQAARPGIKDALLICHGTGQTARALTDMASVRRLDIVDVSKDVIEASALCDPDKNPLQDRRVRVFIEDGRFFLQTRKHRYDLITAEPPPPYNAGVVNLYTRDYFALLRDALKDNGRVTYWLPVHMLQASDAKAICQAFADVFPDATLWSGSGYDWILMGGKNPSGPPAEKDFCGPWADPVQGPELRALGFPLPETLGIMFLADGDRLREWMAGALPLTDDWPRRLSYGQKAFSPLNPDAFSLMAGGGAQENFLASPNVGRMFPALARDRAAAYFPFQAKILALYADPRPDPAALEQRLKFFTSRPLLKDFLTPALWSSRDAADIAAKKLASDPDMAAADWRTWYHLGADAAQSGNWPEAARLFDKAAQGQDAPRELLLYCRAFFSNLQDQALRPGAGFVSP